MSATLPAFIEPNDSPLVTALRKLIRGEALSDDEQTLVAGATRKPSGPRVPHQAVLHELAERERRGD